MLGIDLNDNDDYGNDNHDNDRSATISGTWVTLSPPLQGSLGS